MEPQDVKACVTAAAGVKTINGVLPENNHEAPPVSPADPGENHAMQEVPVSFPPAWIAAMRAHFRRRGMGLSTGIRSVLADYLIGLNLI